MKKQIDKKMRKIENKSVGIFLVLMLIVLVLSLLIAKGVLAEETVSYEKSLTCNIDKICEKETANLDRAFRNAIANGDVGPNPKSADTPCLKPLIPGTNIGIKKSMDWSKDLCDNDVNYPFLDNQVAIQGGFSKELANAIAEAVDCYREEFSNELLGEEITRKAFERIGKISIILLFKDQNDNPLKNDGFSIQFKDTSSQVAHGIFIYHTGGVSSPPVSRILKRAMEEIVLQTKQLMIDEKYIQGKRVPDWIRAGLIYRCDDCDRKLRRQQIIDQWIKSGKYPDFSKIFESKIEIADPHSDDVISAITVVDFLLSEGSAKADKLFEIEREANRETTPGNKFGYERALEFFSSNRIEDLKDFQEKVEKYLQENKFLEDCYKQRKISKPADKSDETKDSNDKTKTSDDIPGFPKKGIIDAIFDSLVKIDLIPDYIIIPVVTSFEGIAGETCKTDSDCTYCSTTTSVVSEKTTTPASEGKDCKSNQDCPVCQKCNLNKGKCIFIEEGKEDPNRCDAVFKNSIKDRPNNVFLGGNAESFANVCDGKGECVPRGCDPDKNVQNNFQENTPDNINMRVTNPDCPQPYFDNPPESYCFFDSLGKIKNYFDCAEHLCYKYHKPAEIIDCGKVLGKLGSIAKEECRKEQIKVNPKYDYTRTLEYIYTTRNSLCKEDKNSRSAKCQENVNSQVTHECDIDEECKQMSDKEAKCVKKDDSKTYYSDVWTGKEYKYDTGNPNPDVEKIINQYIKGSNNKYNPCLSILFIYDNKDQNQVKILNNRKKDPHKGILYIPISIQDYPEIAKFYKFEGNKPKVILVDNKGREIKSEEEIIDFINFYLVKNNCIKPGVPSVKFKKPKPESTPIDASTSWNPLDETYVSVDSGSDTETSVVSEGTTVTESTCYTGRCENYQCNYVGKTETEGISPGISCNNDQECNDINKLDHIKCYEYKCNKDTKICEKFPIKAGLQDFGYCDDTHFEKGDKNYGYCDGNGNCIDDEKCYDDDNGINYAIKGIAHGLSKTGGYIYAEDHCEDSDNLIEYYCDNNIVSYDAVKCSEISPEGVCLFDTCVDKKTGKTLCDRVIKPDGFGTFLWSFDISEGIFVTFRIYAKDLPEGKFPSVLKVKSLVKKELGDNWEIREATGFFRDREDRRRRRLFGAGPLVTVPEGNNKVWVFWGLDKREKDFIELDLYLHRKEGSKLSYEEIKKLLKEIKLCLTALQEKLVPAGEPVPSGDITYNIDIYEACEPYSGDTEGYQLCMFGGNDDAISETGGTTCKKDDCTEGSEKIETSGVKCEDYGKYKVGENCDKDVPGGNCKACLLCNEYTGKCEVPEITSNTMILTSIMAGKNALLNDKQYLAGSRLFEVVGSLDCSKVVKGGACLCSDTDKSGNKVKTDYERGYAGGVCAYFTNPPWPFPGSLKYIEVPVNYNGDKEIFYRCFSSATITKAFVTPGRISGKDDFVCREGKCDSLCEDSDYGKNYKDKGKGHGPNKLGSFIKVEDYCKDTNTLVEYFCKENIDYDLIVSYEHKDCRDYGKDFVCKDGVCVNGNEQTADIDETETGIDYCQLCISSGDINSQSCQLCSYTEDTSVPSETGGKVDLNKILSENENCYYILKFGATWCGPCQNKDFKNSILELAQKYSNKAKLVEIDVDNNKELVSKYGVSSIPRVIVLDKNWKPVPGGDFTGGGLVSQLDNFISRLQSQGKCQKKQPAVVQPPVTQPPITQPPVTVPPIPGDTVVQPGFETPVIVKNQEELKKVLDSSKECLFLLDFYADWCKPCRAIAQDVKRLANKYKGIIKVIKIDNTDINNPNDVTALYVKEFSKKESPESYKKLLSKQGGLSLPTLLVQSKETIFKAEFGAMNIKGPDEQPQTIYNPALEQYIDNELRNPQSDMSKVVKECTTCKESIKKTDVLVGEKIEKEFSIVNSFNFDLRCRVQISEARESCKDFQGCNIAKDKMWISTDPDSDFIIKSGSTGKIKVIINVLKNEDMWGVVDIKCIKAKDYDPKYPAEGEVQLKKCISIDIKVKKEQKPTETPKPPITQPPVTVPPIETPGTGAPGTTPGTTPGTPSSNKLDPQCIPPLEKNGKLCKIQNPNDGCCLNCVCEYPDKIKKAITAATVRIEVSDSSGVSRGSGTIIDARNNDGLIITCGHTLREALKSGKGNINVILYDENGNEIGKVPGRYISSDLDKDTALISISTNIPLTAMPVAPKSYKPNKGDKVISSGLSYQDIKPVIIESIIISTDKYKGPLLTVGFEPKEGRSGGGLFNSCGALIGVSSCADPKDKEGLFVNLDAVHQELDKLKLTWVYDQNAFDKRVKEKGLSNVDYSLQCIGKNKILETPKSPTETPQPPTETPGQPGGGQQPGGGEPGQEQPGGGQEGQGKPGAQPGAGQGKPKGQQTIIEKDKNKCEDDKVTVAPCPPQTEEQKKCDEKFKKDKIAEKKQPDGKLLCGTWNSGNSQASAIDCGPCPKCYVCKNPDSGLTILDLAFSGGFCEPVSNPVFSQGGNQFDVKPDCKKSETKSIINDGCCQITKSTTSSADTAKCGECPGGYTVSPPSTGAPHCDCNENTCTEADKICGSLKDLAETLKKYCANAPNGVPYKTDNFIIRGNGNNCEFAYTAEYWRCRNAVEWTGKKLPKNWDVPADVDINVDPNVDTTRLWAEGGDTKFIFELGKKKKVFDWRGNWIGSKQGLLNNVIPHEVMHTVSANHFGEPLPRWLDEGMSTSTENCSEKQKYLNMLYDLLKSQWYEVRLPDGNSVYARQSELGRYSNYPRKYIGSRSIPFNNMFVMKDYPRDIMSVYAQGWAVTEYLLEKGGKGCKGKQKFYEFVKDGMKDGGSLSSWNAAVNKHYGFRNLDDLQTQWLQWIKDGKLCVKNN